MSQSSTLEMENSPSMERTEHADGISPRRRRVQPLPYLLLVPASVALLLMLGYPIVRLLTLSLQEFGLKQQFGAAADWVGLRNFSDMLHDPEFWAVLRRTIVFCAVNVVLTITLGMAVALLLGRLGRNMGLFWGRGGVVGLSRPAPG